ncbi:MFS transporter [Streptomyces sp. NPDC002920]
MRTCTTTGTSAGASSISCRSVSHTAFAAGCLPTGAIAGGLAHRVGPRPLIVGGLLTSAAGILLTLLLTPGAVALISVRPDHPAWVVPGLLVTGAGMGLAMTAASAAIMGNAPAHRAGMATSVEEVSYELGSLSGVAILGSALGNLYTATVQLPADVPESAKDSLDAALVTADRLPADQAGSLLNAAHDAFDNGYVLTLAITAVVLLAGSAFTARRLTRPTPAPTSASEPTESAAR